MHMGSIVDVWCAVWPHSHREKRLRTTICHQVLNPEPCLWIQTSPHNTSARAMVPSRPSPEEQPEHPAILPSPPRHVNAVLLEVGWTLRGAWAPWRGPEHVVQNHWWQQKCPGGFCPTRMSSRHWEFFFVTCTLFFCTFRQSWDWRTVLHPWGKTCRSLHVNLDDALPLQFGKVSTTPAELGLTSPQRHRGFPKLLN